MKYLDNKSYLVGYPESGAYAYISESAATTTIVADTYYRLAGTFTNEVLSEFNITSDKLTYIGNDTQLFEISITASIQSNTVNTIVTMGIYKNGTLEANSEMTTKVAQTADRKLLVVIDVISLSLNDNIEIRIKSDQAEAQVTAIKCTTTAQKFY